MPSATFTSAGSSSTDTSSTAKGDSPDVLLLVFAYVVPCVFTIGLLLYLFYCCDSKSKKNVDDDDNENNARGLPNEETSLLPTPTTNPTKDYIPAPTTAPDLEEGASKPPPNSTGINSYLPQFMLPTPVEKPTTAKEPSTTTAPAAAPVANTNNKDLPSLLTPTLDNITKTLPKTAATNASAPVKVPVQPNNTSAPTVPAADDKAKDNGESSPTAFPSLYFNPMDLLGGNGPAAEGAGAGAGAPSKVPKQFVIVPEGTNPAPSTSAPAPAPASVAAKGVPSASTTAPVGSGAKDDSEPSSSFPSLYFNPIDLLGNGGPSNTHPEGTVAPVSSHQPSNSGPEDSGTTLLPSIPSIPSMGNLPNPMDLLSGLNPLTTTPPTPGPPSGPPIAEGVARDLVDRNNPVLFEIYLFYSFHAAAVLNARMDGHVTSISAKDLDQHKAVATATDRYDRRLLGHSDFMQLLKEFKILTGPVTGPFVSALLTTEESSLTFRRFVALLLKIGETLQPRYPKQDAFLALLETMDYSEQLYIILESGLVLNKQVAFDVAEPTWRSVINEDIGK